MNHSRSNMADQGESAKPFQSDSESDYPRQWVAIILMAGAAPLIFLVCLLYRYAVDVPAWDDWEMVPIIARAHTGQPFLRELFQQQQEARTVIPKFLVVLLAVFGHWHLTYEIALSVVFSSATVVGIYLLLRRSGLGAQATAFSLLLTALLAFAPTHYEVWMTGSDFSSFLPAFWLVAALVIMGTKISIASKFVGCTVLSFAASFSLAHGLLLWAITFPILLLTGIAHWKRWLLLWLVACAVCAVAYFWDYQKPRDLPLFAPALSPIEYVWYFFIFLGSALVCAGKNASITTAALLGASGFCLFCGALYHTIWRRKDKGFLQRVLPWFALGFYAIGAACLAAIGRVGFGTTQALQSRYGPFALYLFVALIGLAGVIQAESTRAPRRRTDLIWVVALVFLALSLVISYGFSAAAGVDAMRAGSAYHWLGRSAVLFSRAFDTGGTIEKTIYPLPSIVRRDAMILDDLGLIQPSLVKTNNISSIRHGAADGRNATGWCESIVPSGSDLLRASGWAVLNTAGRPADGVVFTYEFPERNWVFFAMSDGISARPDIAARMKDREQFWSGWEATFPRNAFPQGARISAWGIDCEHATIYRLDNNFLEEHF